MEDKFWLAKIVNDSNDTIHNKARPKLTIEVKKKYKAPHFFSENNYYFKLKAFCKNYSKFSQGENAGKYFNVDFAYLQELSTLDMYLREIVLNFTLDIEHFLKVHLLKNISDNKDEDGYAIVEEFLSFHPEISGGEYKRKSKDSYCEDLIEKNKDRFPIWAFVEVLSFGDLINFCDTYYRKYPSNHPCGGTSFKDCQVSSKCRRP